MNTSKKARRSLKMVVDIKNNLPSKLEDIVEENIDNYEKDIKKNRNGDFIKRAISLIMDYERESTGNTDRGFIKNSVNDLITQMSSFNKKYKRWQVINKFPNYLKNFVLVFYKTYRTDEELNNELSELVYRGYDIFNYLRDENEKNHNNIKRRKAMLSDRIREGLNRLSAIKDNIHKYCIDAENLKNELNKYKGKTINPDNLEEYITYEDKKTKYMDKIRALSKQLDEYVLLIKMIKKDQQQSAELDYVMRINNFQYMAFSEMANTLRNIMEELKNNDLIYNNLTYQSGVINRFSKAFIKIKELSTNQFISSTDKLKEALNTYKNQLKMYEMDSKNRLNDLKSIVNGVDELKEKFNYLAENGLFYQ